MPTKPMEYIWPGIIAAQAIYAATKLRIPDLLASGPRSVTELASDCGAHPPTLEFALTFLDLAEVSHSEATVRRNHTNARIAHDAVERLLQRLTPDAGQRQLIDAKLAALKTRLRAVGCQI